MATIAPSYTIEDPRPIAAQNPYSFYVPCQARLDALAAGDLVKLLFVPADEDGTTERMWVEITGRDGEAMTGTLANQPFDDMGINHGDEVRFHAYDVIDIQTDRADDPDETNVHQEDFFKRCLVDARLACGKVNDEGGLPIARMVRDEPEPADFHGKGMFGWSGWRFEAEGYEPGMSTETYSLVVPLRQEAGYAHLLSSPQGTAIARAGDGWGVEGNA